MILKKKHIFTSIKGHNSVVYEQIQPICSPKPLLPDINVDAKFVENRSNTIQVRVQKQSADGWTDALTTWNQYASSTSFVQL